MAILAILLGFAIWFGFIVLMVLYLEWQTRRHTFKPDPDVPFALTFFVGGPLAFILAGALLGVR